MITTSDSETERRRIAKRATANGCWAGRVLLSSNERVRAQSWTADTELQNSTETRKTKAHTKIARRIPNCWCSLLDQ